MKRRTFMGHVATASATLAAAPSRNAAGANDRLNLGWIGCGSRGFSYQSHLKAMPDVEIVAACDVYEPNVRRAQGWLGSRCAAYRDFRKLLENKDIDAVLVTTPDHWHAAITVLACEAGKDVYVEKPAAHNVREGRAMVNAARRTSRIVQAGMQQRCNAHFDEIRRIIQTGELGTVSFVRVWNFMNMTPDGIGIHPETDPPDDLDWDFYLGPAPERPFKKSRFLYSFRYFFDYAGGGVTDLGTHRFDMVHHVMGVDAPKSVSALGGRYALRDDGDVPDTVQASFEYPAFILSYEMSLLNAFGTGALTEGTQYYRAAGSEARPFGMAFHGTNGTIMADRLGFEVFPELEAGSYVPHDARASREALRMDRSKGSTPDATGLMLQDFFDAVRSRKEPKGDIERGQRAATVGHLANIACRTGRKLHWDSEKEMILDDEEAAEMLHREARKPWNLIKTS